MGWLTVAQVSAPAEHRQGYSEHEKLQCVRPDEARGGACAGRADVGASGGLDEQ